jgi:hypothetical protein
LRGSGQLRGKDKLIRGLTRDGGGGGELKKIEDFEGLDLDRIVVILKLTLNKKYWRAWIGVISLRRDPSEQRNKTSCSIKCGNVLASS